MLHCRLFSRFTSDTIQTPYTAIRPIDRAPNKIPVILSNQHNLVDYASLSLVYLITPVPSEQIWLVWQPLDPSCPGIGVPISSKCEKHLMSHSNQEKLHSSS